MNIYNPYKDFTTLRCWKECREVKLFFYKKILKLLPAEEKNNIRIQIRKSARSVTANIAEGHGRFSYQEAIQFYRISWASLNELKDNLITCKDMNYIGEGLFQSGITLIEKAKSSTNGFIKYNMNQKNINKTKA